MGWFRHQPDSGTLASLMRGGSGGAIRGGKGGGLATTTLMGEPAGAVRARGLLLQPAAAGCRAQFCPRVAYRTDRVARGVACRAWARLVVRIGLFVEKRIA